MFEPLETEFAILGGCIHSATCYLEERETPFENDLALALTEQQWRVRKEIEKLKEK